MWETALVSFTAAYAISAAPGMVILMVMYASHPYDAICDLRERDPLTVAVALFFGSWILAVAYLASVLAEFAAG